MRVNIVMPSLERDRFTAGPFTLVKYANGLVDRGHEVRVLATGVAEHPEWSELKAQLANPARPSPTGLVRKLGRAAGAYARQRAGLSDPQLTQTALSDTALQLLPFCNLALTRGAALERLRRCMPEADVTVATNWETVLPVHVYGSGQHVHLMQHYEVWFAEGQDDPVLARAEALLAYSLPLHGIANVSWVAERVKEDHGREVPICWTGLDHDQFHPEGEPPESPFTVVTYGGGRFPWKGFRDAAQAVKKAREAVPDLRWRVFGGAVLPPDNAVAPYEDLGFLKGPALRRAYSTAHVTLCPSWFEGFPIPPLEAMACGSAVVATPLGACDVGRHEDNALVVPAKDPDALAAALVELWRDLNKRTAIAERGREFAAGFTWERSIDRFEQLLEEIRGN